jgi:hypothetical protein
VNWSARDVAEVPAGVMTVIWTIPAEALRGLVAVIEVALFTVYDEAAVLPNLTAVTPVKPVPVIATTLLVFVGPNAGEILVMTGAPYVN